MAEFYALLNITTNFVHILRIKCMISIHWKTSNMVLQKIRARNKWRRLTIVPIWTLSRWTQLSVGMIWQEENISSHWKIHLLHTSVVSVQICWNQDRSYWYYSKILRTLTLEFFCLDSFLYISIKIQICRVYLLFRDALHFLTYF